MSKAKEVPPPSFFADAFYNILTRLLVRSEYTADLLVTISQLDRSFFSCYSSALQSPELATVVMLANACSSRESMLHSRRAGCRLEHFNIVTLEPPSPPLSPR